MSVFGPDHYLADVGCGTLRGGIPLIDYLDEGHYYGIEADSEVLEEGRLELAEAGLLGKRPVLTNDDLAGLDFGRPLDYVWAFSTLIYMADPFLDDCLAFTGRHGATLYGNVNIGDRRDEAWRDYPIVWRPLSFYTEQAEAHGLRVDELGDLASLGHAGGNRADHQRMLRFSAS